MFFIYTVGYLSGLITALLVVVVLVYFKRPLTQITERVERVIESKGPKPRGFVFEPEDEAEEARQRIIEENNKKGVDTPLSDLR